MLREKREERREKFVEKIEERKSSHVAEF